MILADTSAWAEYYRKTGSPLNRAVATLVDQPAELAVTEPVIMELLAAGRSDERLARVRHRMLSLTMLRVGALETYEQAAVIQRTCRSRGETVRSMIDCLIAAVAIREGASILHGDRDFDAIARHTGLQIEPV